MVRTFAVRWVAGGYPQPTYRGRVIVRVNVTREATEDEVRAKAAGAAARKASADVLMPVHIAEIEEVL
jgi:hypothetical protein